MVAYVGWVLIAIFYLWLMIAFAQLGRGSVRDTGVVALTVGVVIIVLAMGVLFKSPAEEAALWSLVGALITTWGMIYVVCFSIFSFGFEAKSLGWYCMGAIILCIWYAVHFVTHGFDVWLTFDVIAWAYILVVAWLVFALERPLTKLLAWTFIVEAFVTLFIPGMFLVTTGKLPTPGIP